MGRVLGDNVQSVGAGPFSIGFGSNDPGTPGSGDFLKFQASDPNSLMARLFGGPETNPFGTIQREGIFNQFMQQLLPLFNANVAGLQRQGAAVQSGTAARLGRRGLAGSGIGQGITALAAGSPLQQIFGARNQFNQGVFNTALDAIKFGQATQSGIPFGGAGPFQPSGVGGLLDLGASFLLPFLQQRLGSTPAAPSPGGGISPASPQFPGGVI
jgi:hypothetical protein